MLIYVPIVVYGLRLFILQKLLFTELFIIRDVGFYQFIALHLPVSEMAKCISMGFLKSTLFTTMFTIFFNCGVFIEWYVYTKFHLDT